MKVIATLICLAILGGLVYGLWSYQLVTSEDGNYLRKKETGGLSDLVVEEKALDRLGRKLSDNLEDLSRNVRREWDRLSADLEKLVDGSDVEKGTNDFKRGVADLKKDVQKRYDKLAKKWDEGKLSTEDFNKKVTELKEWFASQMEKLKKRFN